MEIPETPQPSLFVPTKDHAKTSAPALGLSSPASLPAADYAPILHFQAGVVTATPKIMQKANHLNSNKTTITPKTIPNQKLLSCSDDAVVLCQDTDGLPQVYVPKSDSVKLQNETSQRATAQHTIGRRVQRTQAGQRNKQSLPQFRNVHKSPRVSESKNYEGVESEPVPADVSYSTSSKCVDHSSSKARTPTDTASESTSKFSDTKQYTMRQLGRMALVAARGSRMTTSQIILWIAHTFPYLRVGDAWEASIRQALSMFAEFHGQQIPGAYGNKKLYGFASAALRAQYEAEYPEFCTPPNTDHIPVTFKGKRVGNITTRDRGSPQTNRAIESVSVLSASTSKKHQLTSSIATEQPRANSQAKQDMNFMPFERSVPCRSGSIPNYDIGIDRAPTFRAAHAFTQRIAAHTMSNAEMAQKIAEIKARPSRKQYFGSDHRLAHKRRHGLKDIHDERDGAWGPHRMSNEQQSGRNQDMEMNGDGNRTLRETFNLPSNIIPMNDGHSELAFRDGTLVRIKWRSAGQQENTNAKRRSTAGFPDHETYTESVKCSGES
jgi:hypothetical protein